MIFLWVGILELIPLAIKKLKPRGLQELVRTEAGLELGLLALLKILAHPKTQQSSPFFLKVFLPASLVKWGQKIHSTVDGAVIQLLTLMWTNQALWLPKHFI